MKREDISRLFEGATDEQISALLDINSQDIGRAKRGGEKLQADLDAASEALKSANETIAALEANKADVEKLQRQIDAYKQAEAERAETERQAREEADLEARFSAAAGGRKFLHEMVREGVKRAFGAALKDSQNLGKSDAEIFAALTRDADFFARSNQPPRMPPMGDPDTVSYTHLDVYKRQA